MYITLATRRDNVDYINDKKLAELPGDPVTFYGEIMGDFPESKPPHLAGTGTETGRHKSSSSRMTSTAAG